MKIYDVAQEIYEEYAEGSSFSLPIITNWLRSNLGKFNTLICASYSIDETTLEISPELSLIDKDIFKLTYKIFYADRKINENLGATQYDNVTEMSSDGATVRFVNKNEIAKTWRGVKNDYEAELKRLIDDYKLNNTSPVAINGTDGDVVYIPNYNRTNYVRTNNIN